MKRMSNSEIIQVLLDLNGEVKSLEKQVNEKLKDFYRSTANIIGELNNRGADNE